MNNPTPQKIAELLLSAMYPKYIEDGLMHKFLYGQPGDRSHNRPWGIEFYYKRSEIIHAICCIRQCGPAYLKYLSVSDVKSMLTNFVRENYGCLSGEAVFPKFDGSYGQYLSAETKAKFAEALGASSIFSPHDILTLYPLVPVRVESDFDSEIFFIIKPRSLDQKHIRQADATLGLIAPEQFPPLSDWKGRKEIPASWLGLRSPDPQVSNKLKAAILGALALAPFSTYRYMFSGRDMFGGRITFDNGKTSTAFGYMHTPPLMHDIIIDGKDHAWLSMLASKLLNNEEKATRQVRALEYFYRAWPLDESERFPWLFMALDALFGEKNRHTELMIAGVTKYASSEFNNERLKLLAQLRGSVIHGNAPDVYDAEEYQKYYSTYENDPINDLGQITAICLRSEIFGELLQEHADPNADLAAAILTAS